MVKRACSGVLLSLSVAFSPDEHSCMLLLTNQHDTEVKMGKIKKLVKTLLIKSPWLPSVLCTVQFSACHNTNNCFRKKLVLVLKLQVKNRSKLEIF